MSYEIKLTRPCDHKIIEEDQIVESDFYSVILNKVMNNTSTVLVRINDFERLKNSQTEKIIREDVTSQFNGNNDTIFVSLGPIYDGLKVGNISESDEDVVVKIKVEDENVSGQLTGTENYFIVEGRSILRINNFDFNSLIDKEDIIVTINGTDLTRYDINDINAETGRIQLVDIPLSTDTVTVTYCFKSKIKEYDPVDGRVVLKEKPKSGQDVRIQYFARVNNGWYLKKSERSILENANDIVFFERKNTNRALQILENVSSQFTGIENTFFTFNSPILPLYQDFTSTPKNTLNNSVGVFINGERAAVDRINGNTGAIKLYRTPDASDLVQITYWYQNDFILDRISVDYSVDRIYCVKCRGHVSLADYKINTLGNYEKIWRENKLIQDLKKIIVTVKGSDPIATWYGTTFTQIISTKLFPEIAKTRIASEIIEALTNLKNAQVQQEEYQELDPNEFLDYIQNIGVEQNEVDPTYYKAVVDVVTQSGMAYEIEEPLFYPEELLYSIDSSSGWIV